MILIKDIAALESYLETERRKGSTIGFVPTMGALHPGHGSLLENARKQADTVVCSIFVNPTQFNDPSDFEKYPITLETDIRLLEKAGTDFLFLPTASTLYPSGLQSLEKYELGFLETVLEGQFRPGHFQGVCQVVRRLLEAVKPDLLFLGQKDYQQCMVVKRLLEIMGSHCQLLTCPTIRESDGLAMSSRNTRLSAEERAQATGIYKALQHIRDHLAAGPVTPLTDQSLQILIAHGFQPEYLVLANAGTLEPVTTWDGKTPLVALAAAFMGNVRLIDNLLMKV